MSVITNLSGTARRSIFYKRSARSATFQSVLRDHTARITVSSNYNQFVQQGYGKILLPDDSEDESSQESEQSSQDSQSSEEINPSQEKEEQIDPWSRIQDEVTSRHETKLEAQMNEYQQHGDSPEVARDKAENALLPVYRKELRKSPFGVFTVDACHKERFDLP